MIFPLQTKFYTISFACSKTYEMENISETVIMYMIAIAVIQLIIILIIIKYGNKKQPADYIENKQTLIEILNTSSVNTGTPPNRIANSN